MSRERRSSNLSNVAGEVVGLGVMARAVAVGTEEGVRLDDVVLDDKVEDIEARDMKREPCLANGKAYILYPSYLSRSSATLRLPRLPRPCLYRTPSLLLHH